jgi:hypothetical protein
MRRLHVLNSLERRVGDLRGTVASIARELIARSRELSLRVNELEREIGRLVRQLAPTLPELNRVWCALGRRARRRGGRGSALPIQSDLRSLEWDGTDPGLVRQRCAIPSQSWR